MDPSADSWVGRTLSGRYRIERALRAGGMGAVYVGSDRNMGGRPVVVKHPLRLAGEQSERPQDGELRRRFAAEIARLIELTDVPGVVRITDQGVEDGIPFYVMDFLEGGSLAERLEHGRESPERVVAWSRDVARTLDAVHRRGLVHRDVKPANILFHGAEAETRAHIADFGIVKELAADWGTTAHQNTQIGTPGFMAPEQLLPDGEVGGRADQYALAATMYVALAGRALAYETTGGSAPRSASSWGTGRKRLKPVSDPDVAPHVPAAAAAAIARALSREPSNRFDTCSRLVDAFESGLSGSGLPSPSGSASTQHVATPDRVTPRKSSSRRRAAFVVAAVVLSGTAFLVAVGGPGRKDHPKPGPGAPVSKAPTSHADAPGSPPPPVQPGERPSEPPRVPADAGAPKLPGWHEPLERARAAVKVSAGAAAAQALREALDAGAPVGDTQSIQRWLDGWNADPVLTLAAPAQDAVLVPGEGGVWSIDVEGSLVTGRPTDEVVVNGEASRSGPGPFRTLITARSAGALAVRIEVRSEGVVRKTVQRDVTLTPASPPVPPASEPPLPSPPPADAAIPAVPAWAQVGADQTAEARRLGVPVAFENEFGMRFVLVPGGAFTMGAPPSEPHGSSTERPQRRVVLSPFYLQATETTNKQFRRFKPAHRSGKNLNGDDQPVVNVTHDDAVAFVSWLSGRTAREGARLPTEAEWEYACRAGTTTPFWCGATISTDQENYDGKDYAPYPGGSRGEFLGKSAAVGTYRPNGWGLHEMGGNAAEWCDDWYRYDAYSTAAERDPRGPATGTERVARGGRWYQPPECMRSAWRSRSEPGEHDDALGLRVAFPVPQLPAPVDGESKQKTTTGDDGPSEPAAQAAPATSAGTNAPGTAVPAWAKVSQKQRDEAAALGVEVAFEDARTGVRYVLVPSQTFLMGSPESDEDRKSQEGPQHSVTIRAFYLSVTEVTNAQFERFAATRTQKTAVERAGKGIAYDPDKGRWEEVAAISWRQPLVRGGRPAEWGQHPVVLVSWYDANAFAQWAGASLPSEAQFECALRAGREGDRYPWGEAETPPPNFANYLGAEFAREHPRTQLEVLPDYQDGYAGTSPVGVFAANRYGLFDMSGNAREWCQDDYHDSYEGAPDDGSARSVARANRLVVRGGSWGEGDVRSLRCACRLGLPGFLFAGSGDLSFRVAMPLGKPGFPQPK